MKFCIKCKIVKPKIEFSKHKKAKDGLQSQCKFCRKKEYQQNKERYKELAKKYYQKNKEKILIRNREYHKKYLKTEQGKKTKVLMSRKMRRLYPKRAYARNAIYNAIRRGQIIPKKFCELCGAKNPEKHHPDYNKPLEVVYVCKQCHMRLENGTL